MERAHLVCVSWLVVAAAACAPLGSGKRDSRPNVLFLLVDDLGWTDVGCFGSSFYETPSIDALAAGGMRFTNAYAACPVCSPTRASLMTGKYPQRTGITDYISPNRGNQPEEWKRETALLPASYADRLPHEEVTLAEAFRSSGYATFFAGKWHLGPSEELVARGLRASTSTPVAGSRAAVRTAATSTSRPTATRGSPTVREGEHLPDRLAS